MNNRPVAWMVNNKPYQDIFEAEHYSKFTNKPMIPLYTIPLYTQEQLEEARKLGMQQERALWNLSESTQEIMNTHPVKEPDCYGDGNVYRGVRSKDSEVQTIHIGGVKELTDEEILELGDKYLVSVQEYIGCGDYVSYVEGEIEFARAILRKAQEK